MHQAAWRTIALNIAWNLKTEKKTSVWNIYGTFKLNVLVQRIHCQCYKRPKKCDTNLLDHRHFYLKRLPSSSYSHDPAPVILSIFLSWNHFSWRLEKIKHPKDRNGHTEELTGGKLPALLLKVGTTSLSVCFCPRELYFERYSNIDIKKTTVNKTNNQSHYLSVTPRKHALAAS